MRWKTIAEGISLWTVVSACLMFVPAHSAVADPPLYAQREPQPRKVSWLDEIRRIPPLKHDRGDRWPMILWESVSFEPQPRQVYLDLLQRGLTQHIQLDEKMIPTAKRLQEAGSPVIMMQGAGGPWPAQLAGDPREWAHQFDPGFKPKGYVRPCLAIRKGWAIEADQVRTTLRKFQEAGVTVDAVWMDWEGDPLFDADSYEQAAHCTRCRATLPAWVLASENNFRAYSWRLYLELTGAYLAAPSREIFPRCSVNNWEVILSTPQRPLRSWGDRDIPPGFPAIFSATNPIAYGNTVYFHFWKPSFRLDREHVDQFYTHLLLRQVSGNAANCLQWAPEKEAVPWISRWCPDDEDPKIPIMTRPRYREVLRHLWLRGVRDMQIFNPVRPNYEAYALDEVEDAVAVYDEMLEFREFLDHGEVMGLDVPNVQDDGVIWSGLRLGPRAVVRTFKQGTGTGSVTLEPWPHHTVRLRATPEGTTYQLSLDGERVQVRK